ncbi:hypothetical protein [Salinispira pacifica]|uniref:Uncharacterized protein n=1 Tax=Salinispira pacifica TaxID=1307761 RepID=V5WH31_9SPIO|nr:hypothetical protein [Salinispira pacifica]AHC14471.1 hypothetical protein L21SP2_1055 [Salinispira pacifica]
MIIIVISSEASAIFHHYSEEAGSVVEAEKEDIRLYKTYSDFVSYGFYVARKGRD